MSLGHYKVQKALLQLAPEKAKYFLVALFIHPQWDIIAFKV